MNTQFNKHESPDKPPLTSGSARGLAARSHFVRTLRSTIGIRIRKIFPMTGLKRSIRLCTASSPHSNFFSFTTDARTLLHPHSPIRFEPPLQNRHAELVRPAIVHSPQNFFPLHRVHTHPRLTDKPPQHSCRGLLPAAQDVKRDARNVTSKDPSVGAARPLASSASTPCSCSGVDGHSRDRDSGLAWIQGTCRDWV